MTGLAGPGRLDTADRLSGGPAHHPDVIRQLDRQRGLADIHGDDRTGMNTTQGDLLADDHDDTAVAGHPLHPHRLDLPCISARFFPSTTGTPCTWTRSPFGLTLYGNLLQIIFLQRILSFNIKLYITQPIY